MVLLVDFALLFLIPAKVTPFLFVSLLEMAAQLKIQGKLVQGLS